jgi:hypothetical protein
MKEERQGMSDKRQRREMGKRDEGYWRGEQGRQRTERLAARQRKKLKHSNPPQKSIDEKNCMLGICVSREVILV